MFIGRMNDLLNRMLDEIERLRSVLSKEHAESCAMLRSDEACDCGCMSRAASALLECTDLRAKVVQLQQTLLRNRAEIARLDVSLAKSKAENKELRAMLRLDGNITALAG